MELHSLKSSSGSDSLDWSSGPPAGSSYVPTADFAGNIAPSQPAAGAAAAPASGVSSFFASPFASVGVEYGRTLIRNNAVLNSGVGGWLRGSRLRYYFQVSQLSIKRKVSRLLLPYIHYDWNRQKLDDVDEGLVASASASNPAASWKPASQDVNAPDLYIGMMSFFTFIVLMGLTLGMSNKSVSRRQRVDDRILSRREDSSSHLRIFALFSAF
jgi:hypothetical protein